MMRIAFLTTTFYGAILPILAYPFWGIVFFVWISIFRPEQLAWGETFGRLHLLVAVATFISWLVNQRQSRHHGLSRVPIQVWLMLALYAASLIVTLVAVDPDVSWEFSTILGKALLFGFLLSRLVDRPSRVQWYVRTVALAAGLLALWAIFQYHAGNERLENIGTALPDSNVFAITLVMLSPMVVHIARFDRGLWRLTGFAMTAFMLVAVILSQSRSAFLSLATVGVLLILLARKRALALAAVGLAGLALLYTAPDVWWERMHTITFEQQDMDGSAFNRIILWEIGMRVFEANPVAGVGLEGFSNAKEALAEEYRPQIDPVSHMMIFGRYRVVHNTYVNWLAEGGLVLFTPFLLFLLSGIIVPLPRPPEGASREILAVWQAGRGIPIGILGFSVGAFFLNANYNELFYWQVVLAGVVRVVLRLELAAAAETAEEPATPPEIAAAPAPATT